jgi:four helix bundle protein
MQTGTSMDMPYNIQKRTFLFACRIITFCRRLASADPIVRRLSWQLLDAGTSIGANLEEADAGQTKRDFIAKTSIARKESTEARYWLRLIAFAEPRIDPETIPLIDESHQLLKILTTIIKNAESNRRRGEPDDER